MQTMWISIPLEHASLQPVRTTLSRCGTSDPIRCCSTTKVKNYLVYNDVIWRSWSIFTVKPQFAFKCCCFKRALKWIQRIQIVSARFSTWRWLSNWQVASSVNNANCVNNGNSADRANSVNEGWALRFSHQHIAIISCKPLYMHIVLQWRFVHQ